MEQTSFSPSTHIITITAFQGGQTFFSTPHSQKTPWLVSMVTTIKHFCWGSVFKRGQIKHELVSIGQFPACFGLLVIYGEWLVYQTSPTPCDNKAHCQEHLAACIFLYHVLSDLVWDLCQSAVVHVAKMLYHFCHSDGITLRCSNCIISPNGISSV